ncbi:MAG: response regulator [Trichloromonadaceae bacterium]
MAEPIVLIIEDNEQNIYLATFLLKNSGYQVVQARSGEEGLTQSQKTRPDLILLDIQLPEMDGYEVVRRLKSQPATAAIPVVAVTSYAMAGDREAILAAGCHGYVEKPIDPDTFVATVTAFLNHP